MTRLLIGLLGVLAALFPDGMVDIFERLAIKNSETATTRSWLESAIRSEGLIITLASLAGGRAHAWLMNLTGVFGAIVVVSPDLYRTFATALLYEDPDAVEWNDRFNKGLRAIGVLYVLIAVRAYRNRAEE
jgi:hypothetical protein